MRFKFVIAALPGLFCAGMAFAQVPEAAAPPPADPQNILNLDLSTGGRVRILLRPDKAPGSVERVKVLVRRHFYDGLIFHRVIEGFMAQGGDPKGTGEGGSELPDLKAEFNDLPHVRGTMSMARAEGPNSANSQFFIMLQPNLGLDGNYTAVGRVMSGMQFVDAIEKGEPPERPSKVVHASIESDDQGIPPVAAVIPAADAPPPPPEPLSKQELKAKKEQDKREAKAAAKAEKERKAEEAQKARDEAKARKAAPAVAPAAPKADVPAPDAAGEAPPATPADPGTSAAVNAIANDESIAKPQ